MKLLKVGRNPNNHIMISSPRVSTLHAEILLLNNGDILLEDKGSTNGTRVNGQPIPPGKPVSVRRGDRIELAGVELDWNNVPMVEGSEAYKAVYGIGTNYLNEIQLTGDQISRFHATLKKGKDNRFYIEDHSKNGTSVNGQRIPPGFNVPVTKDDTVYCGDQKVDLTPYMGSNVKNIFQNKGFILGVLSAIVIVGLILFLPFPWSSQKDYSKATACLFHQFHYVVTLENDPYLKVLKENDISGWPECYEFGLNEDGEITPMGIAAEILEVSLSAASPINIHGTAFFVSEDGRLITNRHVIAPWENEEVVSAIEEKMRQIQQKAPEYLETLVKQLYLVNRKNIQLNRAAWKAQYLNSPMKISGKTDLMAIGLPFTIYDNIHELLPASTLCASKSKDIDLAVIQLKNQRTPEEATEHIIDLNKAILNANTLQPGEMDFIYYGYPGSISQNLDKKNDFGFTPQVYNIGLSRVPGKYELEFQGQILPGASGSPVLTKKGQLVGVMNKCVPNTTISIGVMAKYAVAIYNQCLDLTSESDD